ncbi:MAG TPA: hypothetical protein VM537_25335 [Anaerolineae bacterium]|nr:hypothetical protein [Anaerolineae bacterium]
MSYAQTITTYTVEERLPDYKQFVRGWQPLSSEWIKVRRVNVGWLCSDGTEFDRNSITHWHFEPGPPREECWDCSRSGRPTRTLWTGPCPTCKGEGSTPIEGAS